MIQFDWNRNEKIHNHYKVIDKIKFFIRKKHCLSKIIITFGFGCHTILIFGLDGAWSEDIIQLGGY